MSFGKEYHQTRLAYDRRREAAWRPLTAWLQRFIPRDSTVVDVGCGHADFLRFIDAKHKVGIDLYKHATFPKNSKFVKAPVWDVHKHIQGADCILASNLLEHLDEKQLVRALSSMRRALTQNGTLIVLQPNFAYCYRQYFDDYTHLKVFTHVSLRDVLRVNGFKIERVFPRFLPLTVMSRIPVIEPLVALYLRSPWKPFAGQMLIVAKKDGN